MELINLSTPFDFPARDSLVWPRMDLGKNRWNTCCQLPTCLLEALNSTNPPSGDGGYRKRWNSSLPSKRLFVANAARRWRARIDVNIANPPSGDGGYRKRWNSSLPSKRLFVANAARRWRARIDVNIANPPSGDGGYRKRWRSLGGSCLRLTFHSGEPLVILPNFGSRSRIPMPMALP